MADRYLVLPESAEKTLTGLAELLIAKRQTIATAESCTGGLIGGCITQRPGASRYYQGGIIAYSNDAKERLLAVDPGLLLREGAVSAGTAGAMAAGAAAALKSDMGLAVTGIAGPEADGSAKPVGLVYIGVFYQGNVRTEEHMFAGDRAQIREQTVEAALRMALNVLESLY